MNTTMNYQQALAEWKRIAQATRARAERVDRARQDRGWAMAATVGIGRCSCSLHNASIDDNMTGWCKDNPHRLKVAKQANYLVNQWTASHLADRIIKSAWNRLVAVPFGYAKYD